MELQISRKQEKALLGGINFKFSATLKVSEQDNEAINKYKLSKFVLCEFDKKEITINDLLKGSENKSNNVMELLIFEDNIKKGLESFIMALRSSENYNNEDTFIINEISDSEN